MMAAFIIAIQGTVSQAVLLGLPATLSHTAVVWVVALAGQYAGREWGGEATEPYFQLASAVIIVAVAVWMLWRTWRGQSLEQHHHHGDEVRHIPTLKLETVSRMLAKLEQKNAIRLVPKGVFLTGLEQTLLVRGISYRYKSEASEN